MNEKLVIIGSGPAGLTAAIYASRAALNPLIIEGAKPLGQLMSTSYVENWPGISRILGPELMMNMRSHAESFGARFHTGDVTGVDFSQRPFALAIDGKNTIHAESVIIASGSNPRRLQVPGEETYWGKGVTSCAVCDGAFYKDGTVLIVGGGDTAMEDASFMLNFTKDITIVQVGPTLTASIAMQERVINNPHIKIIYNSTVTAIEGDGNHVTHAIITHQQTGHTTRMPLNAIFVAVGLLPNTNPFKGAIDLLPNGYIKITNHTRTSIPGIFACGDATDFVYRQAVTSAGSGCMAALDAERYLKQSIVR